MKEHLPAKSVGARRLVSYKPTFLADAMLGSVARKLRIFGFDTLYIKHIHDDEVLKIGIEDNRVILTCDKGAVQKNRKNRSAWSFAEMF